MPITEHRLRRKRAKRTTVMCSLRIERQLKEGLKSIANRQGRSLSSLISQILKDFLESRKLSRPMQVDKRRFPRKEVVLPGRWRLKRKGKVQEYDVLIKNISADGAYAEHINGHSHSLFLDNHLPALELVVRLPGTRDPAVFSCVPRHCHITEEYLSMGLQFTGKIEEHEKDALEHFLT